MKAISDFAGVQHRHGPDIHDADRTAALRLGSRVTGQPWRATCYVQGRTIQQADRSSTCHRSVAQRKRSYGNTGVHIKRRDARLATTTFRPTIQHIRGVVIPAEHSPYRMIESRGRNIANYVRIRSADQAGRNHCDGLRSVSKNEQAITIVTLNYKPRP